MNSDNLPLFKDREFPSDGSLTLPKPSQMQHIAISNHVRLFWDKANHGPENGFIFYVAQWVEGTGYMNGVFQGEDYDSWRDDGLKCECMFHGIVYYDGLRHLHAGDERTNSEGYLYYARTKDLVKVFTALHALEMEHCQTGLGHDFEE